MVVAQKRKKKVEKTMNMATDMQSTPERTTREDKRSCDEGENSPAENTIAFDLNYTEYH